MRERERERERRSTDDKPSHRCLQVPHQEEKEVVIYPTTRWNNIFFYLEVPHALFKKRARLSHPGMCTVQTRRCFKLINIYLMLKEKNILDYPDNYIKT